MSLGLTTAAQPGGVIAFDLDGTLIDSLAGITQAANALLHDKGLPPVPQQQVAGYVGLGERVFLQRLIADTALVSAEFESLLEQFIPHYVRVAKDTVVFPGAKSALARLRAVGHRLALVTNKPGVPLAPVLEHTGLGVSFDCVVAGDTLPLRKPDPAPLRYVAEQLGRVDVFVGDSPIDAETAQRAGIPFVLFTEGIRTIAIEDMPHAKAFSDFDDLEGIVEQLLVS